MALDELKDPSNPLSEPFQDQVFERGQDLEALRSRVLTDAAVASQFAALVAEQLRAYEQLFQAAERFGAGDSESPAMKFRTAISREIQKLREDGEWARSKRKVL
jgi:hypothetical protein